MRATVGRWAFLLPVMTFCSAGGAERIGKEALLELPRAALWSKAVNFRPGEGEVVTINPPRFSWSYTPDPAEAGKDVSLKEFQFQVAHDRQFKRLAVNVRTVSNMYNFIRPLKKGLCYWRVGYADPRRGSPILGGILAAAAAGHGEGDKAQERAGGEQARGKVRQREVHGAS